MSLFPNGDFIISLFCWYPADNTSIYVPLMVLISPNITTSILMLLTNVQQTTFREYHPENVFASMETIMTLVIEESEDISPELLSPVLASVKKDNEVNFFLSQLDLLLY